MSLQEEENPDEDTQEGRVPEQEGRAEIGGACLQWRNGKIHWPPPKAGEEARKDPPVEL